MALSLSLLSETTTKITLGWSPVPGAVGYRFQSATTAPKWSHTFDASRSQVTFSKADWYKVEALGVEAAGEYPSAAPPPPSTLAGLRFPAAGHKWGGNEPQAMTNHDLVFTSTTSQANPKAARAGNPNLVALTSPALDPLNGDWTKRRAFAFTYGGGLTTWGGGTDNLEPAPQGAIRGYTSFDNGCRQDMDDLQGFALHKADTAHFVKRAAWFGWKLGKAVERGYDGLWSDNLVPGNLKGAGWFYGSDHATCSGSAAEWDAGLVTVCGGLRNFGVPIVGGNFIHRATSNSVRAATNASEHETLQDTISAGPSAFATLLADVQGWRSAHSGPTYLLVVHIVSQSDTAMLRFGLALSCILGGAYFPNASWNYHQSLYQPAEMNPRGRYGRPVAEPTRSGNTWTRRFESGTVSANFDNKTATFS